MATVAAGFHPRSQSAVFSADGGARAAEGSRPMTNEELKAALDRIAREEHAIRSTLAHRFFQKVGPTRAFSAIYRRIGPVVDRALLRWTKGRVATRVYGFPALLLGTTGAKTGLRRTSPLLYVRDGDAFVVVGTNFGTEHHPAWTNNLLATPRAEIAVGADTIPVRAEQVDAETFERIWPQFSSLYDGYDRYRERVTHRTLRMFRLRPTLD
jgi:deazaflavin-dependent oxidoreductase (nitroreductase family)